MTSWSKETQMEPALLVPPDDSPDRALVAMKLAVYLSLSRIMQGEGRTIFSP